MTDTTRLEEEMAHLTRMVEDMSDIIARQERDLSHLAARVEALMVRAADQELDAGGTAILADQKPPHW